VQTTQYSLLTSNDECTIRLEQSEGIDHQVNLGVNIYWHISFLYYGQH